MTDEPSSRVAIVTGASRGLGETLGRFLAGEEYALVVDARHDRDLRAASEGFRAVGVPVEPIPGDVTDAAHRRALVAGARSLGRLDLLVNNASELGPSPLRPILDWPWADWESVLRTNLLAPIALVREALPFLEAAHGLIVNVSSDAAVEGYRGWGGYGASKAALDLVTRTLARELEAKRVAAVSVDPGDMRTAMHQAAYPGEDISDRPSPDATVPFWAWLLGQPRGAINGRRFRAQADHWEATDARRGA
jgi:NAD(P)-dependent dehydrogenase (short-subunit alcohol dehydrogenase family)